MVDAAGDAKRQGSARPDESLRKTPYLSLRQPDEPVAISTHRICIHLHENGLGNLKMAASLASSHFQACRLEMISNMPVEIKECAISNVQLVHPLRGTASAGHRRPVRAVGASGRLRLDLNSRELACRRTSSDLGVVLRHSE
jgi:hypothetical protein